jgi:hypothetical protein
MLDLVPLARPRREMRDMDAQVEIVGQPLEPVLRQNRRGTPAVPPERMP